MVINQIKILLFDLDPYGCLDLHKYSRVETNKLPLGHPNIDRWDRWGVKIDDKSSNYQWRDCIGFEDVGLKINEVVDRGDRFERINWYIYHTDEIGLDLIIKEFHTKTCFFKSSLKVKSILLKILRNSKLDKLL